KGIDVISTVSGGGYSAFYLYSKMILREKLPAGSRPPSDKELFADCIPDVYKDVLPNGIQGLCRDTGSEKYVFQQYAKCRQDILENDCDQQLSFGDLDEYGRTTLNTVTLGAATSIMVPLNFIARTIFDWPVNISPTRGAYLEGIGTAYGLYPLVNVGDKQFPDIAKICDPGNFLNCDQEEGNARMDRGKYAIGFEELKQFTSINRKNVPTWIINATASRSRSIFGWATKGQRDFSKFTLQISPFAARSGFYHDVPDYSKDMDVLQAVTTAAAFFDSNETAIDQPWRMMFAGFQHLAVLDWGLDIPNPNVNGAWRMLHSILPVGLYYLDGGIRQLSGVPDNQNSGYIRLMDGGNNDNLGAYSLYEAGVHDIFISDHSQDSKGEMSDMCLLRNEVFIRSDGKKKLLIPGLEYFDKQCGTFSDDSSCEDENKVKEASCNKLAAHLKGAASKGEYPIHAWKYNVLLGCITSSANPSDQCEGDLDARIFLLKPAINLKKFQDDYLEGDRVKDEACKSSSSGTCEVAAFIAKRTKERGGIGKFPQDSTVGVTFASTATIYGAYRELARWHMSQALKLIKNESFNKELQIQATDPILRKNVK
ncbi:MAG: hypothetical protein AB1427_20460, partial [Thermodesulfobacteriota bacterium]